MSSTAAPAAPAPKVISLGGNNASSDPGLLSPAVFYATGQKFGPNDPGLAAAVAAVRAVGVDPVRWATLNASQQKLVSLAGFVVASPSVAPPVNPSGGVGSFADDSGGGGGGGGGSADMGSFGAVAAAQPATAMPAGLVRALPYIGLGAAGLLLAKVVTSKG